MENPTMVALAVALILATMTLFLIILTRLYVKAGPNEALIIYGCLGHRQAGPRSGVRIVRGGGAIILPFLNTCSSISLEVIPVSVELGGAARSQRNFV